MLKKLVYILLGITAILLVTYFIRYKQVSNFTNRIPATATAVINFNTRQLEHHLLIDLLTHPSSYIDVTPSLEEDSVEEESFSLTKGISIPKNIFLFTDGNTLESAWYSNVFELDDVEELSAYLHYEKFIQKQYGAIELFKKENISFAIKSEKLIISLNYKSEKNMLGKLEAIFKETNFLLPTSPLLKTIVNNKSDICFTSTKKDFLEANFRNGKLEVLGILNSYSDLFTANSQPKFSENSIAHISGTFNKESINFQKLLGSDNQKKFEEFTHLSVDSIISKWDGNFSMRLQSIEHKTDSIITYDYDDDFNKVEVISTQQIIVPDVNISLGKTSENNLYHYFERKNAIKIIDTDTLFVTIPLYEFHASDKKNFLEIFTEETGKYQKQKPSKLNGYVNVVAYLQNPLDIPILSIDSTYENFIKDITVELSDKNEFHFDINALNNERSFLGQLVK